MTSPGNVTSPTRDQVTVRLEGEPVMVQVRVAASPASTRSPLPSMSEMVVVIQEMKGYEGYLK